MEIKIDKNVPIPKDSRGGKLKYPFDKMAIGDSFFSLSKSARGAATIYGRRHEMKFSSREENNGVRIWRVA